MYESPHPGTLVEQQSFDSGIPNIARVYDALIGGKENYAADREAALALGAAIPAVVAVEADVRFLRDHLAPGSYLVISHVTGDETPPCSTPGSAASPERRDTP